MKDSLVGKPTIRPKIQNAKLGICFMTAIMLTSIASIIVVTRIYEGRITEKIENISVLKDNNFKQWAQEPGSSKNTYTDTFMLYNYVGDSKKVEEDMFLLSDVMIRTNYNFTYSHASFGQGNKGVVNMVNKWSRQPLIQNTSAINNFNLGLNKVFNEETMAPVQSRFPVLFSRITDTLQKEFLPDFYAQYLWEFFFQYKDLVIDTIFAPLKFDEKIQNKLLNVSVPYNWVSIEGIRPWIKLCISNYYITQSYFLIKQEMGLTSHQMSSLIGQKSQMHYLAAALNSTIRNKLHVIVKQLCEGVVCTDKQLVAAQWSSAFLTKTPLMGGINIDKLTGQVNTTHRNKPLEFSQSCEFYNTTCLDLSSSHELLTSKENNFLNFSFVNFIVQNQNSPSIVEKFLSLNEGEGQSIINYVVHYFIKDYTIYQTNIEIFSWIWLVYRNFNKVWENYLDFLINNLFGRAFYSQWGNSGCVDYFQGTLEKYKDVCNISGYKLGQNIESYFPYIKAYFFRDRATFLQITGMSLEQSQAFFGEGSLFYQRIQQILKDFNTQYRCKDDQCTFEQLAYRQWGSSDILSDLPSKYFTDKSVSILDWDDKNIYHNYNIEYWSVIKKQLTADQVQNIMTYDEYGVLGEFSLKNRIDERKTKDPEEMIRYLNQILINSVFKGTFIVKPGTQYLFGYTDEYMLSIKSQQPLDGGKPWINGMVSLAEKNNDELTSTIKFTEYDQMNTGIFDTDMIRVWRKRVGRNTTGYKYPVFMQNTNVTYTWVDTARLIEGTNMLGFHNSVSSDDVLNVFVEDLKANVKFIYQSDVSSNKLKFVPKEEIEYFVGNDTLDGFYATIIQNESFIIVQTATGHTIESIIAIKWYIKPGRYLFDVNQTTKAYLYKQITTFKRPNEDRYNDIIETRKTKAVIIPILISAACVSFVAIFILGFLIWRWNKGLIKLQDDVDNQSLVKIDTREREDSEIFV